MAASKQKKKDSAHDCPLMFINYSIPLILSYIAFILKSFV